MNRVELLDKRESENRASCQNVMMTQQERRTKEQHRSERTVV